MSGCFRWIGGQRHSHAEWNVDACGVLMRGEYVEFIPQLEATSADHRNKCQSIIQYLDVRPLGPANTSSLDYKVATLF